LKVSDFDGRGSLGSVPELQLLKILMTAVQ